MDTGHRVADALSLAVNRLDEPPVRDHYRQLLELVDAHLGGQLLDGGALRPLTEPQLVLISYGLKHLRGPSAAPLLWASGRLESALSGTLELDDEAPAPAGDVAARPQIPTLAAPATLLVRDEGSAAAEPRSQPLINSIKQRISKTTGGTVGMMGQKPESVAAPGASDDDEGDTSEMQALSDAVLPTRYDVYISYSRRNAEIMRRIRADLRAAGMSVWTDENLTPGRPSWRRAVHAAVRGAHTMIVIMTPDSIGSEWVAHEIGEASAARVAVFPVLARGTPKNAIPSALSAQQHVDIRKEGDYRQALNKLTRALKQEIKRRERQG
jgi:hypothetical protein